MDSRSSHAASLMLKETTLAMSSQLEGIEEPTLAMSSPEGMPPLTEPDRAKRASTTSSNRPLTGNSDSATAASASPRQLGLRTTPPSGRLLQSTQASAAKATPPSLKYRKPLHSKRPTSIPRRDASAPAASTPDPKWLLRVHQRHADTQASNPSLRSSSPSVASSGHRTNSSNKPLPPRPVVSLVSTVSPSKDGRTLIDASERPMRVSVGDGWPSLTPSVTPRSASSPERSSHRYSTEFSSAPSAIPRRTSGNTVTVAAVNKLTGSAHERDVSRSRTSGLTARSSSPSFVSAEDSVGRDAHSESASVVEASPRNDASSRHDDSNAHEGQDLSSYRSTPDFPVRSHSLANSSSYSDMALDTGDHPEMPDISDSTKELHTSAHEGRQPGASAANFSRPHGAMQPHRTSISSLHTPGSDRTASRIPIPGSKKATLVHVKTQNLEPDPADENSPTFGTRRLISPKALAILDQGTKRRLDLRRANTNNSDASDRSQLASHSLRNLHTRRYSRSSSPSYTTGVSESDTDSLSTTTPYSQLSLPRSGSMAKLTPPDPTTDQYEPAESSSPLDNPRLRRMPPSKSRFTRPLETIPSKSMLIEDQPEVGTATVSGFAKVAEQLSQAQKNTHSKQRGTLSNAKRDQLRDMLTAVQKEDDIRQMDGEPGLDAETKNHLKRTLSQLEGQGAPPSSFIDLNKLNALLEDLGPRSSTAPKSNTLIDSAAVADMFVERGSVSSEQIDSENLEEHNRLAVEPRPRRLAAGTANSTPVISKWSDSTPSAICESTELLRSKVPSSIGFPSATPSATNIPSFTAESFFAEKEASESAIATRNSSLTLGSVKLHQEKSKGSVRHAREHMNNRGDFARMTRASLSKKTARTPTSASKGFRKPQGSARSARGRDSSLASYAVKSPPGLIMRSNLDERAGRTQQTVSTTSHEPRSHSRGRTILNKMTGFFHKRDKKSEQMPVPPLPPLDFKKHINHTTLDVEIDRSKPFRGSPTPPLPAIGNLPQSPVAEPRPSSRATDASDDTSSSVLEQEKEAAINTVHSLVQKMVSKARLQTSPQRQARLLDFAMVLNDGLTSSREVKISAEKARQDAEAAELSYRKTKRALQMLARLAVSLEKDTGRH